jgi:hypothetical protein
VVDVLEWCDSDLFFANGGGLSGEEPAAGLKLPCEVPQCPAELTDAPEGAKMPDSSGGCEAQMDTATLDISM